MKKQSNISKEKSVGLAVKSDLVMDSTNSIDAADSVQISFEDLKLDPRILQAIEDAGYKCPTKIQSIAIPAILEGRDVIGLSQTGTGKTASFVLPILNHLCTGRSRARMPRALVLTPTRELAVQVEQNTQTYGKYLKLNSTILIGGESFEKQAQELIKGPDILIGTPGRILDHIKRGSVLFHGIKALVIDEADRMLDMGFIKDIEKIIDFLPEGRISLLFSATMPPTIAKLTKKYQKNALLIEATAQSSSAKTIKQLWVKSAKGTKAKQDLLKKILLLENDNIINAIIFCNRKESSNKLFAELKRANFDCDVLHGDIAQSIRTQTLKKFKDGKTKILVATDIAARGLDIADIGYVFNIDLPQQKEDYIHRIGRTGRAGKSGVAYNIVDASDQEKMDEIAKMSGDEIIWYELPSEDKPKKKNVKAKEKNTLKKPSTISKDEKKRKTQPKTEPSIGFGENVPSFILTTSYLTAKTKA